tara:strand:- start:5721 stop:7184 length:1464 start_codon:yes stop_codon:yes gene_type:complete
MLPLLFSLGLPALAPSIGLGAVPAFALSGIGAGLGEFFQTGDVGKGIKTGLLAGLGSKLFGGLGGGVQGLKGSVSQQALTAGEQAAMLPGVFQDTVVGAGIKAPMSGILGEKAAAGLLQPGIMTGATIGSMASAAQNQPESRKSDDDDFEAPMPNPPKKVTDFSGDPLDTSKEKNYFDYRFTPQPDLEYPYIDYGTAQEKFRNPSIDRPIPFREGGFMLGASNPMFMGLGQGIRRAMASQDNEKVDAFVQKVENDARAEFGDIFQPQQMQKPQFGLAQFQQLRDRRFRPEEINTTDEFLIGPGGGGRNPNYTGPKTELPSFGDAMAGKGGGIKPVGNMFQRALGFAQGGEIEDMNEKDIILEAILAIKGMKSLEEAQMILGKFLSENGEEALRDLIKSVKSGEYDDTVARFAAGEKGMVRGPSDGSGKDDKVPATMDNQQDVLLTEGEFVMRKPTTDALTKAYGGGFLDRINEAEKDAPKVLEKMVG